MRISTHGRRFHLWAFGDGKRFAFRGGITGPSLPAPATLKLGPEALLQARVEGVTAAAAEDGIAQTTQPRRQAVAQEARQDVGRHV